MRPWVSSLQCVCVWGIPNPLQFSGTSSCVSQSATISCTRAWEPDGQFNSCLQRLEGPRLHSRPLGRHVKPITHRLRTCHQYPFPHLKDWELLSDGFVFEKGG
ncbi:hypothetical protein JRQ81_003254 [Phrynocephalus forsythii]|uniref:Uncharacterized protein n=1 Tax=Phrynocephalus forsythii TaxID=171643 RepID=A0A9Q0XJV3_9SAUR|nr:hypothetical protein JRQ81_003254 [Phrynocephalus forsythii]